MTSAQRLVTSADDLFALPPLARFEALIAGPNFDDYLRAEPIRFDPAHPIYGTSCRVPRCERQSTQAVWWCTGHAGERNDALRAGIGDAEWLSTAVPRAVRARKNTGKPSPGAVSLAGLRPLVAAEIRYALWTHTKNAAPARWHPMWLRTLVKSCRQGQVKSLLDLDPADKHWTTNPAAVNRVLREMLKDVEPIHRRREDTRELGYLDTNYWGFRFPDRRSAFDLSSIPQRWLRELTWDYIASALDGPDRPRSQGPFEAVRRALVSFGTYVADCDAHRGEVPSALTEATAKDFIADLRSRVSRGGSLRGVFNVDGSPSTATATTYPLIVNALRRVMRWAMDSGAATDIGLARPFIVAIPNGGSGSFKNPRPFTDTVLRELSDPSNIRLFDEQDPYDSGLGDIWSIQVQCGRRIGEVVKLRLDCVGEHLGRTWMWVDMTKVGKLDYAIQIPRDIYDLIRVRQAKTFEQFRLKHGAEPTPEQQRVVALFPSRMTNPTLERSISASTFSVSFRAWLAHDEINLPGHTTHQARHTLATRLVNAGASMTHVKRVLGHVSERMSDSYVLIAGSQVEPFLQQIWVTGPGNANPGAVVLTPTDSERSAAEKLMVDLAAIPTEHGLCTYKPVVGGSDCPFERKCHSCEHFVITGADYAYWKRQEERWAAMAEGAPDEGARDYIYDTFRRSSQALAGLEKALLALGLLDQAKDLDLRSPQQDFFDPIWTQGWRAGDLIEIGSGNTHSEGDTHALDHPGVDEIRAAS